MDAAGDFVVSWETDQAGSYQVYARRYARTSLVGYTLGSVAYPGNTAFADYVFGTNPLYTTDAMTATVEVYTGPNNQAVDFADYQPQNIEVADNNGAMGGEFLVSDATDSSPVAQPGRRRHRRRRDRLGRHRGQRPAGRHFQPAVLPTEGHRRPAGRAGARLRSTRHRAPPARSRRCTDDSNLAAGPTQLVVTFDKPLLANGGVNSVLNMANWSLTVGGVAVADIASVQYGLNEAYHLGLAAAPDGKYEAVVTFNQSLSGGYYILSILDAVEDTFGNKLDGDYNGTPGGVFNWTFSIAGSGNNGGNGGGTAPGNPPASTTTDPQVNTEVLEMAGTRPAVAMDANGDYVVVWTSSYNGNEDIEAQQFNQYGQPMRSEFQVNVGTNGNFYTRNETSRPWPWTPTATSWWFGRARDRPAAPAFTPACTSPPAPRRQSLHGQPERGGPQQGPSVAMDPNGNFVVTWSSYGEPADPSGGVYARRFNTAGVAQSNDFLVNTYLPNYPQNSLVRHGRQRRLRHRLAEL